MLFTAHLKSIYKFHVARLANVCSSNSFVTYFKTETILEGSGGDVLRSGFILYIVYCQNKKKRLFRNWIFSLSESFAAVSVIKVDGLRLAISNGFIYVGARPPL
jgi:hypothetical protein